VTSAPDPAGVASPTADTGPLTRTVLDYDAAMKRLVAHAPEPIDWSPLARFVALDDFERVGTFLEVQNWTQYTEMLERWAGATDAFETSVRRISELGALVYYEIEERHFRGDGVNVINSMTVFEFDGQGRIRRMYVYLQLAR
jgi:Asp-tRNA(Asn)/Glu-tRNA(Gln) amidotransferase A subunit family amidase